MIAHGTSHAAATFVGAVAASVIAELIVRQFNFVDRFLGQYFLPVSKNIGLTLTNWQIIQILVLLSVGFIWGVLFKWAQRRS